MSISKKSLQSVLSAVEELKLGEGEYLALCDVLKKEFEKKDEGTSVRFDRHHAVIFRGKKDIKITLHAVIYHKGERPNEIEYSVDAFPSRKGVAGLCFGRMEKIYRINETQSIGIVDEEAGENFSRLEEWVSHLTEWRGAMEREEEDVFLMFGDVMKFLFSRDILC